jgi:hypothetical protein
LKEIVFIFYPEKGRDFTTVTELRQNQFYTLVGMSASSRSRSPISRRELGWKPRYVDMPKSLLEDDYDFFGNH